MNPPLAHILVADDEENTRLALMRALQFSGYQTSGAANGREVFEQIAQKHFDLLLLDLRMPEVDGVEVLERIRSQHLELAVIVLTAHASLDSAIASVKAGATDYLLKPQKMSEIEAAIRQALQKNIANQQRRQLIEAAQLTLQILNSEQSQIAPLPARIPQPSFDFDAAQRLVTLTSGDGSMHKVVTLTADQAAILGYFMNNQDKALSSCEIARKALSYPEISNQDAENLIRSHILRLRQKIEFDPHHPIYLRTIRDAGYIFSNPELQ